MDEQTSTDTAVYNENGESAADGNSHAIGEHHENVDRNLNSEGHATRVGEMNDDRSCE